MNGELRTYIVSPEFWNDQPEVAARLLSEQTAKHPDAFWMILIAPHEDATAFMQTQLFHFGPAETIEEKA